MRRSRSPIRPAAGRTRTPSYPGGNPFPALNTQWATAAFPAFGVYVNAPIDMKPTALQQWNVSAQRQFGDWMLSATYLGNQSVNLWRATELNPAVFAAGATTGNTNQRRVLIRKNPVEGQVYGTIGQVDDTGRGIYHGLLLSAQRRMKNNLSVLTNWTVSQVHVGSGDDRDHRADDCRSQQSGPRLLATARPTAAT